MPKRGKAKTLDKRGLMRLLKMVDEKATQPDEMKMAIMLSFYAGLRVQEIAGLRWSKHIFQEPGVFHSRDFPVFHGNEQLLDVNGNPVSSVENVIEIDANISKYTGNRALPISDELGEALLALWEKNKDVTDWVIPQGNNGAAADIRHRANALRVRLNRLYKDLPGFEEGVTTHSGRRSFGTRSAIRANLDSCSIRDTQSLLGHKSLQTTMQYVDLSSQQAKHVKGLW